jgi:hypothetical protein
MLQDDIRKLNHVAFQGVADQRTIAPSSKLLVT